MNSNSRNYYICQKLKAGPVIPPPDQYRQKWLALTLTRGRHVSGIYRLGSVP